MCARPATHICIDLKFSRPFGAPGAVASRQWTISFICPGGGNTEETRSWPDDHSRHGGGRGGTGRRPARLGTNDIVYMQRQMQGFSSREGKIRSGNLLDIIKTGLGNGKGFNICGAVASSYQPLAPTASGNSQTHPVIPGWSQRPCHNLMMSVWRLASCHRP